MAQKAAKSTAKRNTDILRRTHLIAIAVHGLYWLLRALIFRRTFSRGSLVAYFLLSGPSLVIEFVFERNSRPKYNGNELRTSGDDLEAKGLTEWMWDVVYWTWGCIGLTAVFGDWAWYLYIAVPLYSAWLAYSTFGNVKQMLGMGGGGAPGGEASGAQSSTGSKRQQKMEKRGGQKMQYR